MGNTNSTAELGQVAAAKDFKPLKKVTDKYLGEITFLKSPKSEDLILKKEIDAHDPENYQRKIEEYSFHFSLKHKNLAKVYAYVGDDTTDLFRNASNKIGIYFEHFSNNLESTLQKKRVQLPQNSKRIFAGPSRSGFFEEPEIFNITMQLIDVLEYLQQHSVSHGEIRPGSIFFANDKTLKIVNRRFVCDGESAYEKVKNGDPDVYLTPIAFESVGKRQPEPFQNKYKADMFSLGMTLLECATLKKSSQIYDWNNFTVNSHLLSGRIVEMRKRYTQPFCNLVHEMLQLDENKRMDFIRLKQYLSEEKKVNSTIITSNLSSHRHLLDDEDFFLKDFILNMDSKNNKKPNPTPTFPKSTSRHTFVQKPTITIESAQVEFKEIMVGDTPLATTKNSMTDIGDSCLRTFREEEYDEGASKKNIINPQQKPLNDQDLNKVTENSAKKVSPLKIRDQSPSKDSANLESDKGDQSFTPTASPIKMSPIKVRDLLRQADHTPTAFQFNFEKIPVHHSAGQKVNVESVDENQMSPSQTIQKRNGDENSGLVSDNDSLIFTRRTQLEYPSQRNYEADTSIGGKKDSVSVSRIIQEALARAKKCRETVNKVKDRPSIPRNPASNFNSNRTQISYTGNESPPQYNSLRGYSVERRSITEADSPPNRASYQSAVVANLLNKYTQNSSQRVNTENLNDYRSYDSTELNQRYSSLTKSSSTHKFGLPLPIPSNRTDISYSSAQRVNTDQTDYARTESPVPYARINLSLKRSQSAARDRGQKPLDLNTILEHHRKEGVSITTTSAKSINPYETPQRPKPLETSYQTEKNKERLSTHNSVTEGDNLTSKTTTYTQPDQSAHKLQPSSFGYRQVNAEIEERIRRAIERTNHTRELVKRQESNSPTKIAAATSFTTAAVNENNTVISINKCDE